MGFTSNSDVSGARQLLIARAAMTDLRASDLRPALRLASVAMSKEERRNAMNWTFQLRGKDVTLTQVEGVVAVRPSGEARSRAASSAQLVRQFGHTAIDTSRGGRLGVDLPSQNRQLFQRTGWLFVEPEPRVARAAPVTRESVRDA